MVFGVSLVTSLALDLPKFITRLAAALHLRHEQQQQDDQNRDRQQVNQEAQQDAVLGDLGVEIGQLAGALKVVELAPDLVDRLGGHLGVYMLRLLALDVDLVLQIEDEVLLAILQDGLFHVPAAQLSKRGRRVYLGVLLATGEEATQRDGANDHQDDPHHRSAEDTTGTFHAYLSASRPALPISQSIR